MTIVEHDRLTKSLRDINDDIGDRSSLYSIYMLTNTSEMYEVKIHDLQQRLKNEERKSEALKTNLYAVESNLKSVESNLKAELTSVKSKML